MPYTPPTAADLKARYPAFSAVSDDTLTYWITDSGRTVDESWIEADYQPARLALAAHNMALAGIGAGAAGNIPAGVTDFRSGAFSVSFSSAAADASAQGGYAATRYGQEFAEMLRRSKGGPRVTGGGGLDCNDGFNGYAGPLPTWWPR